MKKIIIAVSLLVLLSLLSACAGREGPPGPVGPAGPAGPEGPQGPAGAAAPANGGSGAGAGGGEAAGGGNGETAGNDFVGDTTCSGCHPDIYDVYSRSGHPFILNRVGEEGAPDLPFTEVNRRPDGYDWGDILFVVGGYNWKALFVNQQGYIITGVPEGGGDSEYGNQLNLPNEFLGKGNTMVPYHAGEAEVPYDCGACHTTGYNPVMSNELPGVVGTWVQEGVRCEECHGPGSQHASDPNRVSMRVERDASSCNECHRLYDGVPAEATGDQFIEHHDAYGDLFPGKHAVLDCVDCHDPHTGVVALREAGERTTQAVCADCHYEMVNRHKVPEHAAMGITCLDCHMPRIIQVAWGEPGRFAADMRTHQVVINPGQLGQTTEDATEILPQVGLNFACRRCHLPNTSAARTDEELINAATGYHSEEDTAEETAPPAAPTATTAP